MVSTRTASDHEPSELRSPLGVAMIPPTNLLFTAWTQVTSHHRLRMFDRLAAPDPSTLAPNLLASRLHPSEPMVAHIDVSTNVLFCVRH